MLRFGTTASIKASTEDDFVTQKAEAASCALATPQTASVDGISAISVTADGIVPFVPVLVLGTLDAGEHEANEDGVHDSEYDGHTTGGIAHKLAEEDG